MNQSNKHRAQLYLVILCLAMCFLMIGTAFGRYEQTIDTESLYYIREARDQVLVYGGQVNAQWLSQDSWPALSESWTATVDGAKLDFSVANGTNQEGYAQRDQEYRIRLVAGLSIEASENLSATLAYQDSEQDVLIEYIGTAEEIVEGTVLHGAYGDGWIYRFCDETGEELVFQLPGGSLGYQNFTVRISGEVKSSLVSLQVIGEYAES